MRAWRSSCAARCRISTWRATCSDAPASPTKTRDTLPLAAEPVAAALDVLFEWVAQRLHPRGDPRRAALAPFPVRRRRLRPLDGGALVALDRALADARYLGDAGRLAALVETWAALPERRRHEHARRALPAARVAAAAAQALLPMATARPAAEHIATLLAFLDTWLRPLPDGDALREREARVRAAVLGACRSLAQAYGAFDADAALDITVVAAAVRRWLGAQTFAPATGEGGVQIVDAATAPYGIFDDDPDHGPHRCRLARARAPQHLLSRRSCCSRWPGPTSASGSTARAQPSSTCWAWRASASALSTVTLEDDAVVEPSAFLHDLRALGAAAAGGAVRRRPRACSRGKPWRSNRRRPTRSRLAPASGRTCACPARAGTASVFHGEAGPWTLPRVSVSRLERYLDCPFKFFASQVLSLDEPVEDDDSRTPLERGLFLHEFFERFFAVWKAAGHASITAELLPEAHQLFDTVAASALAALPAGEGAIERLRLFGIGRRAGHCAPRAGDGGGARRRGGRPAARVRTRRRLHVHRGRWPQPRAHPARQGRSHRSAQRRHVPSHRLQDPRRARPEACACSCRSTRCASNSGSTDTAGRHWRLGEASYLSYEGPAAVTHLTKKPADLPARLADAQGQLLDVLDGIAGGHFPVTPAERSLCSVCAYASVCRKDYVDG